MFFSTTLIAALASGAMALPAAQVSGLDGVTDLLKPITGDTGLPVKRQSADAGLESLEGLTDILDPLTDGLALPAKRDYGYGGEKGEKHDAKSTTTCTEENYPKQTVPVKETYPAGYPSHHDDKHASYPGEGKTTSTIIEEHYPKETYPAGPSHHDDKHASYIGEGKTTSTIIEEHYPKETYPAGPSHHDDKHATYPGEGKTTSTIIEEHYPKETVPVKETYPAGYPSHYNDKHATYPGEGKTTSTVIEEHYPKETYGISTYPGGPKLTTTISTYYTAPYPKPTADAIYPPGHVDEEPTIVDGGEVPVKVVDPTTTVPVVINPVATSPVLVDPTDINNGTDVNVADSQCGVGNAVSCCNTDNGDGGLLALVLGGSCSLQIPIISASLGNACNAGNTFCCPTTQDGAINVALPCIPINV